MLPSDPYPLRPLDLPREIKTLPPDAQFRTKAMIEGMYRLFYREQHRRRQTEAVWSDFRRLFLFAGVLLALVAVSLVFLGFFHADMNQTMVDHFLNACAASIFCLTLLFLGRSMKI